MPDDNLITAKGRRITAIPAFNGDSGVMRVMIQARITPEAVIFITGMALLQ